MSGKSPSIMQRGFTIICTSMEDRDKAANTIEDVFKNDPDYLEHFALDTSHHHLLIFVSDFESPELIAEKKNTIEGVLKGNHLNCVFVMKSESVSSAVQASPVGPTRDTDKYDKRIDCETSTVQAGCYRSRPW